MAVIGPWDLIFDLGRDGVGKTTEAAIPCADVEAGADMGEYVLKRIGNSLEVALLESNLGSVLISQIVDLFLKDKGFLQEVDKDVKSLCDSDEVGAEFRTILTLDVQVLEHFPRSRMLFGQLVEDGGHDLHFAVGVGGVPDGMPHVSHLLLVLHRAAVRVIMIF